MSCMFSGVIRFEQNISCWTIKQFIVKSNDYYVHEWKKGQM